MAANADSAADILESITISDHGADEMACGASAATSDIVDGAHVHLGYALRRLLRAYPTEFGGRITKGSKATCVIGLIVMLESGGHSVPVAVQAADAVGFNLAKVARESAPQKCE